MDRDFKEMLVIGLLVAGMLYLLKPKKEAAESVEDKYTEPKVASDDKKKQKDDAVVAMQAVKDAMANNESSAKIKELTTILTKEYGIVVKLEKGKLKAFTPKGELVAEEA